MQYKPSAAFGLSGFHRRSPGRFQKLDYLFQILYHLFLHDLPLSIYRLPYESKRSVWLMYLLRLMELSVIPLLSILAQDKEVFGFKVRDIWV